MRRHTGDFKLFCGDCGKGFFTQSKLESHKRKHTGTDTIWIQWGSEYRPFEYWKHLNTKLVKVRFQMVQYLNGWSMCYVLCTRLTIWKLDQYIRKQNGIHLSGIQIVRLPDIQMAFESNLFANIWIPNYSVAHCTRCLKYGFTWRQVLESSHPSLPSLTNWVKRRQLNLHLCSNTLYEGKIPCHSLQSRTWLMYCNFWYLHVICIPFVIKLELYSSLFGKDYSLSKRCSVDGKNCLNSAPPLLFGNFSFLFIYLFIWRESKGTFECRKL